jgi:hypothetical protein
MNPQEVYKFLKDSEAQLHKFCRKVLRVENLLYTVLKFKPEYRFKSDENGNSRNWRAMEEAEIRALFELNQTKGENSI